MWVILAPSSLDGGCRHRRTALLKSNLVVEVLGARLLARCGLHVLRLDREAQVFGSLLADPDPGRQPKLRAPDVERAGVVAVPVVVRVLVGVLEPCTFVRVVVLLGHLR